ncbi:MAG TPA: hypothetical protein PLI51_01110 [bacterium]|mgnify:FL=1|nr:hypothetical protein [bacterium]HPQ65312.1 hypothetical protein [bacterium]
MKKAVCRLSIAGACLLGAGVSSAQTLPPSGFSFGGFYEYRVENEIADENLNFQQYGARIQFRDRRWVEFFVDLGGETIDWEPVEGETALCAGLGATFWLMRQEYGYGAFDLGIHGSGYYADYQDLEAKVGGAKTDVGHYRYLVQAAFRSRITTYFDLSLRGGILGSYLDPDQGSTEDDVLPAIDVGFIVKTGVRGLSAALDLTYYQGVGGGIHLDYWF